MEKALQERGWYLSADGIERCKEGLTQPTVDNVIKAALDYDLREIGSPALQELIIRGKDDFLNGPLVLQIQKIRNVSAPKANEKSQHAPQLLRLYLTDGCGSISVIQGENWSSLKLFDKAPGTKIFIKNGPHSLKGPLLQLDTNSFSLLGGKVEELVEKWKIKQSMSHRIRSACGDVGPPPWVPFGQKIDYKGSKSSFKSLDTGDKETVKEQQAFDEQRKATIAEISKSKEGVKKTFGKGKQEVKQPTTDGRRRDSRTSTTNGEVRSTNSFSERPERKPRSNFRKDRGDRDDEAALTAPSKPSTIFDFLETKLIDVVPSIAQVTVKETPKPQDGYEEYETSYNQERGGSYNNQRGDRTRNFQKGNRHQRDTGHSDYNTGTYGSSRDARDSKHQSGSKRDQYERGYNNRDQRYNATSGRNNNRSNNNNNVEVTQPACPQPNPINFPELGSELVKEQNTSRGGGNRKFTASNSQGGGGGGASYASNTPSVQGSASFKKTFVVGDHVMARYWEDRKFYAATIFATSEGNTCVVQFTEYGNYEEVLIDDVFVAGGNREQRETPRRGGGQGSQGSQASNSTNHHQDASYNAHSNHGGGGGQNVHRQSQGHRGGDWNEYNSTDRRSGGARGGGGDYYQQRPRSSDQDNRGPGNNNSGNKRRTYKPSIPFYQPPRQREQ